MPSIDIIRESHIVRTPRVLQLEGIFDVPPTKKSQESWTVDLPLHERDWNIGLVVGPSGSGKTTILKEVFGDYIFNSFNWDENRSILDAFPQDMGIKDIIGLLSSVGFASPPSWLRPFYVLSTGEQFRVNTARALAESKDYCALDEFTSVVDRTVAQIGSHAVAKTVRKMGKKFIAASCHYDVEAWLQPDWIYKPHENVFKWRRLRQRPRIDLKIIKVHRKAWKLFRHHHYLTQEMPKVAQCFIAFWQEVPVAFYSYLHFQNNRLKHTKRGCRVVCLPDYQGVGIGLRLEEHIASCLVALGWDYIGASSHPARMAYCSKSDKWLMIRKPRVSLNQGGKGRKDAAKYLGRMIATFRYVGPPAQRDVARNLIEGDREKP